MKLKSGTDYLFLIVFILSISVTSNAQENVNLKDTPNEVYEGMINYAPIKNDNGEGFCWNARFDMDKYLNNYEITKNTEWLDAGVQYYDFLVSKMRTIGRAHV